MLKTRLVSFFSNLNGQDERPFFIILTLILAGMFTFSVGSSPELRLPQRLIPFTLLMNVHIGLYWLSFWVDKNRKWLPAYLILQGGLAFAITALAQNMAMIFGLYMGLIGLAIGQLRNSRWVVAPVGYYLTLSLINFGIEAGWQNSIWWFVGSMPMSVFVIIYVVLYNRQSEARERSQRLFHDLQAAHHQLAEYAARVEDLTIATERQRMARELHDTLSQGLAGLILQLEAVDAHLTHNRTERAQAIVRQTMERARLTLTEARQVIDDLRQTGVLDLEDGVHQAVERFQATTGFPCELEMVIEANVPAASAEIALRAISEGLTNIARHARATRAWLRVYTRAGRLEIELRDDGVGFDPAAIQPGHYGLLGIRERVRLAQGEFALDGRPGQGACLKLSLPLA